MRHPELKELEKKLSHLYCYYKSNNILAISEDKSVLPFINVICEESIPNHFLLSIAVDYPNPEKAVEVALYATRVKSTVLTDGFFISNNGSTYVGDEAYNQYELENTLPLDKMSPLTDSKH